MMKRDRIYVLDKNETFEGVIARGYNLQAGSLTPWLLFGFLQHSRSTGTG